MLDGVIAGLVKGGLLIAFVVAGLMGGEGFGGGDVTEDNIGDGLNGLLQKAATICKLLFVVKRAACIVMSDFA
uniref:Uncharacterized protein n=1 Tax=Desertifilum tharense IPPAS B-1220 TaxID=1781255 RepID=A0ACD5GS83_9CYAN